MLRTDRIEERMAALGLNPYAAAKLAGLGPDYVRDLIRGKVKQPSAHRLSELARVLEASPEYLMGTRDDLGDKPWDSNYRGRSAKLSVQHVLREGFFEREAALSPNNEEAFWAVSFKYEADEWLERVIDPQLGGVVGAGEYIHVIDPAIYFEGITDCVIVERTRDGGALKERSLRRVRKSSDGLRLSGLHSPRAWSLEELLVEDALPYGRIVGAAVASYRFFGPGYSLDEIPF